MIVQDVFHHTNSPKTAAATYALAKQLEAAKGYTRPQRRRRSTTPTSLAVTNATAKKYGLKTIADLKKVGSVQARRLPGVQDAEHVLRRLHEAVRAHERDVPAARRSVSAYAALDAGKVLAADVFSTDPPLGKPSKYTVLTDPKHVTGFQNVAPIVKTSVATALGAKFTTTVNAVSAKLTLQAIVAMNKAVEVDKQSAGGGREGVPEGERAHLAECASSFSVEGRPASISSAPSAGSTPTSQLTRRRAAPRRRRVLLLGVHADEDDAARARARSPRRGARTARSSAASSTRQASSRWRDLVAERDDSSQVEWLDVAGRRARARRRGRRRAGRRPGRRRGARATTGS